MRNTSAWVCAHVSCASLEKSSVLSEPLPFDRARWAWFALFAWGVTYAIIYGTVTLLASFS